MNDIINHDDATDRLLTILVAAFPLAVAVVIVLSIVGLSVLAAFFGGCLFAITAGIILFDDILDRRRAVAAEDFSDSVRGVTL